MITRSFSYLRCVFFLMFSSIIIFGCKDELIDPTQPIPPINVDTSIPSGQPNVILIMGDDVGMEIPTYNGGESYSTPNIDALSTMGMRFTRAYTSPLCSPTRFALLTGKYNFRNYYDTSWGSIDFSQRTIANMLKDAGYATCLAGKWQMNGGDSSIRTLGFQRYSATNLFKFGSAGDDEAGEGLYKDPQIYQDWASAYTNYALPQAFTKGKYGEDLNRDYMFNFMDSSSKAGKPFFCYWAINLIHKPFCPTPDDPEFASWDSQHKPTDADSVWFPSMVKYYDKEIGMLVDKLKSSSYGSNTIVLYLIGDNGTIKEKHSNFRGQVVEGGKGKYYDAGIHIPMIVYWPGHVIPNSQNGNLVDLVDFMPTIAALTNTQLPTTYGPLDGISFTPQIFGYSVGSNLRQYSFNWYNPSRSGPDESPTRLWAMDTTYKQYDSVKESAFYNFILDPLEEEKIKQSAQTDQEKAISAKLQGIIEQYKQEAH